MQHYVSDIDSPYVGRQSSSPLNPGTFGRRNNQRSYVTDIDGIRVVSDFTNPSGGSTGALAATDLSDTATATGALTAQGTLASTDLSDTATATGALTARGTLVSTESTVDTAVILGNNFSSYVPSLRLMISPSRTVSFISPSREVPTLISPVRSSIA